jgi:large subunit ribosomal protein L20|uniref:Large ribosomal subunit protein bL20c n=2 Tax=Cyanidioschyzon merolae TaxID=45157 RepID=RK20_CYAM1|nr:ribosomal protein L20 [Cyanidioschyzon merolae strain 10D]Q85FX4.1 RecName: Full=Large ribosomal subunit protein bL20c; AltName: Full=50S ribosomal protein L20 [Cyanidioschyzon merolae strain 10D]QFV17008.1 50S ribosomal protein L20 [Cyanidioschyzon merolae]QFV17184.1 50S ribosomal protein L20 [Cyanidioschyzon merolae]BAC76219.1 50S ribosomal protein L20 [Cyanidioschyzon merolae strain 10D]
MVRIKRGNVARKRRQKILKAAKGFYACTTFRAANERVMKSWKASYRGRKLRKRDFRRLWITRLNAILPYKYSKFVHQLKQNQIALNRKMLYQLSCLDQKGFEQLYGLSLTRNHLIC